MSTALDTLDRMTQALTACGQGQLAQSDMIRQWRSGAASLQLWADKARARLTAL